MNNTFNIRRFGNYARMNYWYHKKQYLITILAIVVLLFIFLCNFQHITRFGTTRNPSDYVIGIFSTAYYVVGVIFTIAFVSISMRGVGAKNYTMQDMLIPVSTFERYIFIILNSTVVAFILFTIIFQIVGTCTESLYHLSDNGYMFKSLVSINDQSSISKGYTQEFHYNLKDILGRPYIQGGGLNLIIQMEIILYTLLISVVMWGEITFKKFSIIMNILAHVALFVLIVLIYDNVNLSKYVYTAPLRVTYSTSHHMELCKNYIVYASYILPITYQWVIWKKLKTLTVTK
ncbi:MAG: hypothetical protein R3Y26_00295 [Rikenellaceae bacterium]